MPFTYSVKAMLLLMDCKDKMLLSDAIALKNTGEDGNKKRKEVRMKLMSTAKTHLNTLQGGGTFIDYGDIGKCKVVCTIIYTFHRVGVCGGERALGKAGKVMVEIMIVVSQIGMSDKFFNQKVTPNEFLFLLGFCCAYLIFVSENLHSIFPVIPK